MTIKFTMTVDCTVKGADFEVPEDVISKTLENELAEIGIDAHVTISNYSCEKGDADDE